MSMVAEMELKLSFRRTLVGLKLLERDIRRGERDRFRRTLVGLKSVALGSADVVSGGFQTYPRGVEVRKNTSARWDW